MLTTKKIIAVMCGVIGVLLIVRGVWGGAWPLSFQLIAGVLLVIVAVYRWWMLS